MAIRNEILRRRVARLALQVAAAGEEGGASGQLLEPAQ
jgi:heme exporter protein C